MCGRFAIGRVTKDDLPRPLMERVGDFPPEAMEWEPRYNIKPTQPIPVVLDSAKRGEVVVEKAFWSLLPPWADSKKLKYPTFNARSEKLTTASTWRVPVKHQRCVVVADGYYEWTGEKGSKQPWYIHPEEDRKLGFAGLYSWWKDPEDDKLLLTATIVTMPSVPSLERIHDRNPVTLPLEYWARWIDPNVEGGNALVEEAVQTARDEASWLQYYPVAPIKRDSEGPGMLEPVELDTDPLSDETPF